MSQPVIAIVTGSRDWKDEAAIHNALNTLPPGSVVFHGNARGADTIAARLACARGFKVESFTADWKRHGPSAGPIRNGEMARAAKRRSMLTGEQVVCLAFPLPRSKGTPHMMQLCREQGWEVRLSAGTNGTGAG